MYLCEKIYIDLEALDLKITFEIYSLVDVLFLIFTPLKLLIIIDEDNHQVEEARVLGSQAPGYQAKVKIT